MRFKSGAVEMKKGLTKIISAVALLAAALPCAASPVLANSGPNSEYGITAQGVFVRNEQSVLAVESEKLTFDIVDMPTLSTLGDYKSTVTAEYNFVNTSANTVHTSMAFPLKTSKNYRYGEQVFTPEISVNGVPVECAARYTCSTYTGFDESVKQISDAWYSDDFYRADLPVTKYAVSVERPADYESVRISAKVRCDESKARYIGWGSSLTYYFDYYREDDPLNDVDMQELYNYSFYVLGDVSALSCEWKTEAANYRNNFLTSYKRVDIPCSVTVDGETTLKELILANRPEDSVISELDYYNAVASNLYDDDYAGYPSRLNFYEDDALLWYTYDVEVEPNGRFTNKVTAPIFPTIDFDYDADVCEYEYYLSPAAKWASFGTLEVRVNSKYYMYEPPAGFEKCEGGYKAEFSSLPHGELSFRMSSSKHPRLRYSALISKVLGTIGLVFLCIICFVVPLAVFMPNIVAAVKKRRADRKLDFSSRGD